jgi:hypothetical protein
MSCLTESLHDRDDFVTCSAHWLAELIQPIWHWITENNQTFGRSVAANKETLGSAAPCVIGTILIVTLWATIRMTYHIKRVDIFIQFANFFNESMGVKQNLNTATRTASNVPRCELRMRTSAFRRRNSTRGTSPSNLANSMPIGTGIWIAGSLLCGCDHGGGSALPIRNNSGTTSDRPRDVRR